MRKVYSNFVLVNFAKYLAIIIVRIRTIVDDKILRDYDLVEVFEYNNNNTDNENDIIKSVINCFAAKISRLKSGVNDLNDYIKTFEKERHRYRELEAFNGQLIQDVQQLDQQNHKLLQDIEKQRQRSTIVATRAARRHRCRPQYPRSHRKGPVVRSRPTSTTGPRCMTRTQPSVAFAGLSGWFGATSSPSPSQSHHLSRFSCASSRLPLINGNSGGQHWHLSIVACAIQPMIQLPLLNGWCRYSFTSSLPSYDESLWSTQSVA
ncbi:unnamed protein product [Medioppia subpectinata]|uniref:Uncharacterized protein n=1 Tax=Medioppia subpectinata TaxID=1979941 RepID=A0A7R9PX84_9ACAR|nr:unnamed protein product [Medioppia subpectinata]CAG2104127.1 unnamed protein product [Medioppia subpectinata]